MIFSLVAAVGVNVVNVVYNCVVTAHTTQLNLLPWWFDILFEYDIVQCSVYYCLSILSYHSNLYQTMNYSNYYKQLQHSLLGNIRNKTQKNNYNA